MDLPPCAVDPDEDTSPRCPHGHGPMTHNAEIDGTYGAAWGRWWCCPHRSCGAAYLAPNDLVRLLASISCHLRSDLSQHQLTALATHLADLTT